MTAAVTIIAFVETNNEKFIFTFCSFGQYMSGQNTVHKIGYCPTDTILKPPGNDTLDERKPKTYLTKNIIHILISYYWCKSLLLGHCI